MFEQTYNNIDVIPYKDAGCSSGLDYVGQMSALAKYKPVIKRIRGK